MKIKWLKIDNVMVAVDTSSGEIVNESLATLKDDFNVSECVSEVLGDLFGKPLITTALIQEPSKRGPKPKQVNNPYASYFANVQYSEDTGRSNMNSVMDDLIYSASTVSTGNTRIPVKQLVNVMRGADLSAKGIQESLGKRRIIKGETGPKIRYCQELLESTSSLIKRINAHVETGSLNLGDSSAFIFEADSVAYERSVGVSHAIICPIQFTEGDKRTIRRYARAGNLQAMNQYIQDVTEHSGRMLERLKAKPLAPDSKKTYADLYAEFPYEPYADGGINETPIKAWIKVDDWMITIDQKFNIQLC